MATPDWLAGGQVEKVVGASHPIYANTKDRCGQTIYTMLDVEHIASTGFHDARNAGFVGEINTFAGNGSSRTISLSNAGLTPYMVDVWEVTSVAEFITNGGFTTNTVGWGTTGTCSIASVAGGISGNCCQITTTGANTGGPQQISITTVPNRYYTISFWLKSGTSGNGMMNYKISFDGGANWYSYGPTSSGTWIQYSQTQIATPAPGNDCIVQFIKADGVAGTMLIDSVSLTETYAAQYFRLSTFASGESCRRSDTTMVSTGIGNFGVGTFAIPAGSGVNTSGQTNYYQVVGVDITTVPTGDAGAGSDPSWIESSVLNRIIADNTEVVSSDNIANNVESEIWTQFIEEHTVNGVHSVTLQHMRVERNTYSGNNNDDRDIVLTLTDLDIKYLYVFTATDVLASKTEDMAGDTAKRETTAAFAADNIQSIGTGTFQVGTALNASGITYFYLAIGV